MGEVFSFKHQIIMSHKNTEKTTKSIKQRFSKEEDILLIKIIKKYGTDNWEKVSKYIKTRSSRQCREKFVNHRKEQEKRKSLIY